MDGRHFPTLVLATTVFTACRIDSLGEKPAETTTTAGPGGGDDRPATSVSSGGPQTAATASSSGSTGGSAPGSGGQGGAGGTGDGGTGGTSTSSGGDGGGGAPPVDECVEQLDDCMPGERCVDLTEGFDCSPLGILILEESDASRVVADGLDALGASPISGPGFGAWDGINPPLDDLDAVVWFQAVDYTTPMQAQAQAVLAAFVADGGGLVRTEWAAYQSAALTGPADALLPVTFLGTDTQPATWLRVVSDHPIGAALPSTFDDPNMRYSLVSAGPRATIVWENAGLIPLVVTTDEFGGRVVYVNHDVTYLGNTIGPEATQIFVDATLFAAR
jgi:hypothetical protein